MTAPTPSSKTVRTRAREHRLFLVALLVGTVVRVLVMVAFRPGFIVSDAHTYLGLVDDFRPYPDRVIGYAAFLKVLSWLTSDTWLVAGVQHALGLATAAVGYALLRRWGVSARVATLACLPVLLDAMQLVLEHSVLTDVFFDFLLMVAVAVLAWRRTPTVPAVAVAGVLLGLCVLVRIAAEPIVLSAVVFCLSAAATRRAKAVTALVVLAAFAVPLLGYATWYHVERGPFALTSSSGRALYMRTTGFVDCTRFVVPSYEQRLCPGQPLDQRLDPTYYGWHHPDRTAGLTPPPGMTRNQVFGDFARRAIRAQPGDYVRIVLRDSALTFAQTRTDSYEYQTAYKWQFDSWADYRPTRSARKVYAAYGGQLTAHEPYAGWLVSYGRVGYTWGPLMLALLVLSLAGLVWRRPSDAPGTRPLIFLTGSLALGLMLVPDVTAQFVWRYVLPGVVFLPSAAALAWTRLSRRAGAGPAPERPPAPTDQTVA